MSSMFMLGQEEKADGPKESFGERLVFGGDVILSFSNNNTALGLSPLVGYRVTDRYVAGVGGTYVYYSFSNSKVSSYGGRVFNTLYVTEELLLHAEFEHLTFTEKYDDSRIPILKRSFPAVLVGGGYRQPLGAGAFFNVTVLYDILQDPNSLYNGMIIRGGFVMGF